MRDAVLARCGGHCERCGIPLASDWALHHRKLRGQGGRDTADNLMALHHHCHNLGSDSVHLNPANAYAMGWLVKSHDDPATVPVHLPDGVARLCADGNYQWIKKEDGNVW